MMMTKVKALKHAVLAGMLVASATAQSRATPQVINGRSFAGCRLSGGSFANSMSQEASVAITAEASAYLCADPDTPRVESTALGVAKEIATATATAIASVVAECVAEGNGEFIVRGRSVAQAEAFAVARSFAEGFLEANVCDFCSVAADFVADSFEKIMIGAAAEAEVVLEGVANGGSVEASAEALVEEFVTASTTAFAKSVNVTKKYWEKDREHHKECDSFISVTSTVLIEATADANAGCTGTITGVVGGFEDRCTISVGATDASVVSDADTELIVDLVAEACDADEDAIVEVDATATAIATAMARAIAEITTSCEIQGDTTACVVSEANIKTAAEAVASSFGFAIIDARSTCDIPLCETSAEILTEAFETILAEAAASAVFAQCSTTGDQFSTTVLSDQIVTATATSLTRVLAQASVVGGVCDFDADVVSQVTANAPTSSSTQTTTSNPVPARTPAASTAAVPMPTKTSSSTQTTSSAPAPAPSSASLPTTTAVPSSSLPKCGSGCARTNRQCDGLRFDAPLACCDAQDMCVRRNSRFSQCRRNGVAPSRRWDGTIVQCQA